MLIIIIIIVVLNFILSVISISS